MALLPAVVAAGDVTAFSLPSPSGARAAAPHRMACMLCVMTITMMSKAIDNAAAPKPLPTFSVAESGRAYTVVRSHTIRLASPVARSTKNMFSRARSESAEQGQHSRNSSEPYLARIRCMFGVP